MSAVRTASMPRINRRCVPERSFLDVYAEDGMTLEQLMAFTITNDQAR
jgi:ParB family transcriptional regulator, chromosome partitioning protein